MTGADPLLDLLARCVVRIDRGGDFAGTGFFVAPGEVLTCAHVAHGGLPLEVIMTDGQSSPATPVTPLLEPDDPSAKFYPQPDAVILRLEDASDHPCVRLDVAQPAHGQQLHLKAYVKGEYSAGAVARSGATVTMESTLTEDGFDLIKLKGGQVLGGFSGGPLLNLATGSVCAMVDTSRSVTTDLGGFGVPMALIIAEVDQGLAVRNRAFHQQDTQWRDAIEDQRARDHERTDSRRQLPLIPPVADFEWNPSLDQASALLLPRNAAIPYVPRGDLLDQAMLWLVLPLIIVSNS